MSFARTLLVEESVGTNFLESHLHYVFKALNNIHSLWSLGQHPPFRNVLEDTAVKCTKAPVLAAAGVGGCAPSPSVVKWDKNRTQSMAVVRINKR